MNDEHRVSTVRRIIKTVYFGYRMLDFGSIIFYIIFYILQKTKVFYFISEIRNPKSAIV